jgi:hypothetical protein
MNARSLVLVAALVAGCHSTSKVGIGLRYPPLPPGYVEENASLLSSPQGGASWIVAKMQTESTEFLWLARELPPMPRQPRWELRDTLRLPAEEPGRTVVVAACTLQHQPDDIEIVAIAKTEAAESLTTVYSAWRADRRLGRFVAIPTSGIVCANEGYGVDRRSRPKSKGRG